ncbi:MAG: hypothetical protein Q9219_007094 [cf. Caloplaca sp. 3 TL-2023]
MDPFRSDKEVLRSDLKAQLTTMGVPSAQHEALLGVSSTADMVRRTARNIIASIQTTPHEIISTKPAFPELDGSLYSALWALLLLPEDHAAQFQRARSLPYILDHVEKQFMFDVCLIENVEDKSVRYVAEENIVDISTDAGAHLVALAGRHFKRYDKMSKSFVSNLKDEYPND